MKYQPLGFKIIAIPVKSEEHLTERGIIGIESTLQEAEVVEFSPEFKEVYKVGDKILIPKEGGDSTLYNGKPHLFLDGRGSPIGDVWAIVTDDK